ncbi:MAG: hypothetical protein Kow00120_19610 [Anaerolineae bacterium]
MCQVNVYLLKADQTREMVARQVASLYQDGGDIVLTDTRGQQTRMPGMILGADLLRAVVFIGPSALVNSTVADAPETGQTEAKRPEGQR